MNFYNFSLAKVERYLSSKQFLYCHMSVNNPFAHCVRQIVDTAMEIYEKCYLTGPALPEQFSIDAIPHENIADFKLFLKNCLIERVTINVCYKDNKLVVSITTHDSITKDGWL